jgi:hypothetical protein
MLKIQLIDLQRMRLPAFSVKKKCKSSRAVSWQDLQ